MTAASIRPVVLTSSRLRGEVDVRSTSGEGLFGPGAQPQNRPSPRPSPRTSGERENRRRTC
jgi:hypothetical protein